jgi:hypothetical protein
MTYTDKDIEEFIEKRRKAKIDLSPNAKIVADRMLELFSKNNKEYFVCAMEEFGIKFHKELFEKEPLLLELFEDKNDILEKINNYNPDALSSLKSYVLSARFKEV